MDTEIICRKLFYVTEVNEVFPGMEAAKQYLLINPEQREALIKRLRNICVPG